jgi:glycine/D-amino acid oxidase-like deaminating enzyme
LKTIHQLKDLRATDPNLFTEQSSNEKPVIYQVLPRLFGNKKQVNKKYGTIDENGTWKGISIGSDTLNISDQEIPVPIIDINRDILSHSYDTDLDKFRNRTAYTGYRYIRKKSKGLRIEKEPMCDGLLIHNYGHGGAGVTLSWGCAVQLGRLLIEEVPPNKKPLASLPVLNLLRTKIRMHW